MKNSLYVIYDADADKFSTPQIAENDALAIRMFMISLKSIPEEVRTALTLWRVCDIVDNGSTPRSDVVVTGDEFDSWSAKHKKENV